MHNSLTGTLKIKIKTIEWPPCVTFQIHGWKFVPSAILVAKLCYIMYMTLKSREVGGKTLWESPISLGKESWLEAENNWGGHRMEEEEKEQKWE